MEKKYVLEIDFGGWWVFDNLSALQRDVLGLEHTCVGMIGPFSVEMVLDENWADPRMPKPAAFIMFRWKKGYPCTRGDTPPEGDWVGGCVRCERDGLIILTEFHGLKSRIRVVEDTAAEVAP